MQEESHKPSCRRPVREELIYKETTHEDNKTRILGGEHFRL